MKGKRGQTWETLIPWFIGIAVLVIMIILAVLFKEKLAGYGTYLRNLFRR